MHTTHDQLYYFTQKSICFIDLSLECTAYLDSQLVEVVHEYTLSAEICEYLMGKRQPLVLHDYIAVMAMGKRLILYNYVTQNLTEIKDVICPISALSPDIWYLTKSGAVKVDRQSLAVIKSYPLSDL